MSVLEVKNLTIQIRQKTVVSQATFSVDAGTILGIIGESGSGKSTLCNGIMGLLPPSMTCEGDVLYDGKKIVRGRDVSMITQHPMSAFNPLQTIGRHFIETLCAHHPLSKKEAHLKALEALTSVQLSNAEDVMKRYPVELSGGMLQRVMIALQIVLDATLLIADEPTTALDTLNQKEILRLLRHRADEAGTAIIIVTHDLGVIAEIADTVVVMKDGKIVEYNDVWRCFDAPQHSYTKRLMEARW